MCPEIVQKREYTGPPTDIWSSGVLLFALLCGQFPFRGSSDKDLYKKIMRCQLSFPDHMNVSKEAQDFVSRMICPSTTNRATASELQNLCWLNSKMANQSADQFLSTKESSAGLKS